MDQLGLPRPAPLPKLAGAATSRGWPRCQAPETGKGGEKAVPLKNDAYLLVFTDELDRFGLVEWAVLGLFVLLSLGSGEWPYTAGGFKTLKNALVPLVRP